MKGDAIMPEIAALTKGVAGAASGISPANHSAWLEQLESAQWQQRLRYRPEGGQQQSRDSADLQQRADSPLRNAAMPMPAERPLQTHARSSAAMAGASEHGAVHVTNKLMAQRGSVIQQGIAALAPYQQRLSSFGPEQGQLLQQNLKRLQAGMWQSHHMHAMQNPDGVKVWLRDARYETADGYRLLHALRGQFANLGLRLAQFTLNGRQVPESDRFD